MDSLIARAIYGLIVLLAVGGVIYLGDVAYTNHEVSAEIGNVAQLAQNIKGLYGDYPSYSSLNNTVVINAKIAPVSMQRNGVLLDTWGGSITVQPDPTYSTAFDVSLQQVPSSECNKLVTGLDSNYVSINGGAYITAPFDPATVSSSCSSNTNTVMYVFG